MASNDLFNVEDQTDEDFFDKLVEDDLGSPMPSSTAAQAVESVDRSDFDSVQAFASLSFGDESDDAEQIHGDNKIDKSSPTTPLEEEYLPPSKDEGNGDSLLVKAHSLVPSEVSASESDGVMKLKEEGPVLEAEAPTRSDSVGASILDGSEGSGIKVLGWNEFYGDSSDNSGIDGLDVFSGLGNNVADLVGNIGDAGNLGDNIAMGITQATDTGLQNQLSYGEYHGSQLNSNSMDQTATTQDASDNQYWENMYPGWKYDAATGQWYQVDYHEQTMASQQSNSDLATASLATSNEVAYQRQSSQSVESVIAETSTSETVASWNLVSQASGSYPEHMVFDPQYPGWYYDTIAQEWRTLDSYNASNQSGDHGYNAKAQNGYVSSNAHLNDDGASTFVGGNAQNSKRFSEDANIHGQHASWSNFNGVSNEQKMNSWQPEIAAKTETFTPSANAYGYDRNNQVDNNYGSNGFVNNLSSQRSEVYSYEKASQGHFEANTMMNATHNFGADMNLNQQYNSENVKQNGQRFPSTEQFPYALSSGRSPDGRPAHAIVNFGFGGKLIVMKDNSSSYGSQASGGSSVSILNVMETVAGSANLLSPGAGNCTYFRTLCHQSYPGPLTGGSVGSKDLNKWIDEKILDCDTAGSDYRKAELLKLIISLLKIACQHYGKLRSPFGTDTTMRESETPESSVAKLFASLKKKGSGYNMYGALSHCLQHIPTEDQQRTAASEVQNLLVSGRKIEALQCAQEGQLWGPALIIATQLGEQFYVDTVKQMALRQLVEGSPLRTLCLLIAGQPAEVFSTNNAAESGGFTLMPHQNQNGSSIMLDEWEENLAVITANRTKDDELVITHLGDCLWKDRSEILAAHVCYLIAEMNFEPYSDTARLCLIGADHWKFPRTYASPEAIQRTELYEYSKVLGNSQYILIPFQPYKIIYAHMLAEVGKLSDALKYCQAVQKSLKTGRAPEVDAWKQLISSLEERIRLQQQGGFTNLAPAKLVGKLLNFFDSTAHRVVGGLPPPAPGASHENTQAPSRVLASQSTMAMSSLVPSTSMQHISGWASDGNKKTTHSRSVSEPDFFSRAPRQVEAPTKDSSIAQSKESGTAGTPSTASTAGTSGTAGASRFGRFGFLQKTVDLVRWSRGRQAKLGEENKFYYDENLKRWVEKGANPVAEEPALPPPPTTAAFQNGTSDFGSVRSRTSEIPPTGTNSAPTSSSPDNSSGMPPIPSSSNQFSSRGRTGVRARYVDTFNQGRSNGSASKYQPPAVQSVRPSPAGNANFFIPTTPVHTEEQNGNANYIEESNLDQTPSRTEDNHNHMLTSGATQSFQTPPISSGMTMQRFPSMDNIRGSAIAPNSAMSHLPGHSRRASWGGNVDTMTNNPLGQSGLRPLGEVLGLPPAAYMSPVTTPAGNTTLGEELHDVDF